MLETADFYHVFALLTPAEQDIAQRWRSFLLDTVVPIINDYWEAGEFPHQIIPPLAQLVQETLVGTERYYPKLSPLLSGWLAMEMGRAEPSLGSFYGVHKRLCMNSIYRYGSEAQKEQWLPALLRFEKIGSWVLTEPEVGSGAAAGLQTIATPTTNGWLLNGQKKWSGNASFADINVVWAKNTVTGQVNGFLVEKGMPGYHIEKIHGKIAKRVVQNVLITLDQCEVPAANRLPGVERFRDLAAQLTEARADVAWEALGIARGAFEYAFAYCQERHQFGKPIGSFQLVQAQLVKMLGNITAMQAMLCQLAKQQSDIGSITAGQGSLAKAWCSEKMRETVALARNVLGGNGVLLEHHVARLFADAEALYSYEGTYEINTLIVGKEITGHSAFL